MSRQTYHRTMRTGLSHTFTFICLIAYDNLHMEPTLKGSEFILNSLLMNARRRLELANNSPQAKPVYH